MAPSAVKIPGTVEGVADESRVTRVLAIATKGVPHAERLEIDRDQRAFGSLAETAELPYDDAARILNFSSCFG